VQFWATKLIFERFGHSYVTRTFISASTECRIAQHILSSTVFELQTVG